MKAVLLIPTYNNAAAIGGVVSACRKLGFPVVVVNDGSTDGSETEAQKAGAIVLNFKKNRGKGAALRSGLLYIKSNYPDADFVVTMDADGQHDPADLPEVLERSENRTVLVIGRRQGEMPRLRRWVNNWVSSVISAITDIQISDTQSGFRVIPRLFLSKWQPKDYGYGIETEMIFAAKRFGLPIKEVPIKTIYRKDAKARFKKDLSNALDIARVIILEGPKIAEPKMLFRGAAVLFLFAAIFMQVRMATKSLENLNRPVPPPTRPDTTEMLAALSWLKKNTPADAVIFAPQIYGHRVMAFADRAVITSTKVYPSEATEVARRYRDIGRVLFAGRDEDALPILEKYGAKYIFIPRNAPLSICKEINSCHYVASGRLTSDGMRKTLLGRLLSEVDSAVFTKNWSSHNFLIYSIKGTGPIPCAPSKDEKTATLRWARAALEEKFFDKKPQVIPEGGAFEDICFVDVTLWIDGKIRGSRIIGGVLLRDAIRQAAINSSEDKRFQILRNDELNLVTLEVYVWDGDARYPVSKADALKRFYGNPQLGYLIESGENRGFFLPSVFNVWASLTANEFFSRLCLKAGMDEGCMKSGDTAIYAYPVSVFKESIAGEGITDVYGPLRINPVFLAWREVESARVLRERVRNALDWILSMQRNEGAFRAALNPGNLTEEPDREREDALSPFTSWVMAEGYASFRDKRYLNTALNGLQKIDGDISGGKRLFTYVLMGALANCITLYETDGVSCSLPRAETYARLLATMQNKNGTFPDAFRVENGVAEIVGKDVASDIVNNSILYALSRYQFVSGDKSALDSLILLKNYVSKKFVKARILSEKLSLAEYAWLVNGFRRIYEITGEPEDGRFALNVARWLMDYQYDAAAPGRRGAFQNTPSDPYFYTRGSGKNAEALADALWVAYKMGEDTAPYEIGLQKALLWLQQMQVDETSTYLVPSENRIKTIGGIRENLFSIKMPIDSAEHFALAGMLYLDFLSSASRK